MPGDDSGGLKASNCSETWLWIGSSGATGQDNSAKDFTVCDITYGIMTWLGAPAH